MDKLPENVIKIDLVRFERNRNKLCQCNSLHIEIDTQNRKVYCQHCQTERDPYDVLTHYAKEWEKINDRIEATLQLKRNSITTNHI